MTSSGEAIEIKVKQRSDLLRHWHSCIMISNKWILKQCSIQTQPLQASVNNSVSLCPVFQGCVDYQALIRCQVEKKTLHVNAIPIFSTKQQHLYNIASEDYQNCCLFIFLSVTPWRIILDCNIKTKQKRWLSYRSVHLKS